MCVMLHNVNVTMWHKYSTHFTSGFPVYSIYIVINSSSFRKRALCIECRAAC